ncbi:MAG: DUF1302 domain-containing protein [Magnetospiraceae bacterium]
MQPVSMDETRQNSWRRQATTALGSTGLALALFCGHAAIAGNIDVGNDKVRMYFDTTLKYSGAIRVGDQKDSVADMSLGPQMNTNDGDLNFDRGLISNRIDALLEFGINYDGKYGLRLSGAGWYDTVYNQGNDNPGAFVNSASAAYNDFTDATRNLHGRDMELLDAFVYGNFTPGDMRLNLKVGRFTQLYGESLFFGSNGVAGAQTSLDLVKALSVPNSQFKEIMRPTGQISAQLQVTPDFSIGVYYQGEWRKHRLPGAGSYFSFADFVDEGGETLILGPGAVAHRGEDMDGRDSGQGGIQLKYAYDDYEFGFYAAQFHDKAPQFYVRPGVNATGPYLGDYMQVFHEDIRVFGASVSTLIGDTNVAAEVSVRDNMSLVAPGNAVVLPGNTTADNNDNAAYPTGRTGHLNISAISVLEGNDMWDGATFLGEFAANGVLNYDKNKAMLDPLATDYAGAFQFLFTPEYFQVMPGVDLQVPIGFSYGLFGRSAVNGVLFPSKNGGNISVGLKFDVQRTWQASLGYTHYFGPSGSIVRYGTAVPELSYKNFHGDRDFISFSVQTTF